MMLTQQCLAHFMCYSVGVADPLPPEVYKHQRPSKANAAVRSGVTLFITVHKIFKILLGVRLIHKTVMLQNKSQPVE